MPRIRTTKPEFWTREDVLECSPLAPALYKGIENFADDYGNITASHKSIKAKIYPDKDVDIDGLIKELIAVKMLIPYTVDGCNYYHLRTFLEDQKIDRPSPAQCPPFDDALRSLDEDSTIKRPVVIGEGSVKEVKTLRSAKPADPYEREFQILWKEYPEKKGKHEARLKFLKQVQTTKDLVDIKRALTHYKQEVARQRDNGHPDLNWQHGSTWFNHRWKDYVNYKPPPSASKWDNVVKEEIPDD